MIKQVCPYCGAVNLSASTKGRCHSCHRDISDVPGEPPVLDPKPKKKEEQFQIPPEIKELIAFLEKKKDPPSSPPLKLGGAKKARQPEEGKDKLLH